MSKILFRILALLQVATLFVCFSSCSKDEEKEVSEAVKVSKQFEGKWFVKDDIGEYTLLFSSFGEEREYYFYKAPIKMVGTVRTIDTYIDTDKEYVYSVWPEKGTLTLYYITNGNNVNTPYTGTHIYRFTDDGLYWRSDKSSLGRTYKKQ